MPFNKYLVITTSILILFFGDNVLQYFGYMISTEDAPSYQKIHPAVLIFAPYAFIYIYNRIKFKSFLIKHKIKLIFLIYFIVLINYMTIFNLNGAFSFIPNTLILPILLSIVIHNKNDEHLKKNLRTLLLFFFITNCSFSIIEMFIKTNIFLPLTWNTSFIEYFRSTAFQNHPLNNALITSIIISFILAYNYCDKIKFSLYFIGFISIICFGTRSSLLIWATIFPLYLMFNKSISRFSLLKLFISITIIITLLISLYYIIVYTSFGERLVENSYFDDSANTRVQVFEIFKLYDFNQLFLGVSITEMQSIGNNAGVEIIENFWINWLLRFGLIFFISLTILLFMFIKNILFGYSTKNKIFIVFSFLIIASANNSLSAYTPAISVFVLCSFAFSNYKQKIFNTKRLSITH